MGRGIVRGGNRHVSPKCRELGRVLLTDLKEVLNPMTVEVLFVPQLVSSYPLSKTFINVMMPETALI